MPLLAASPGSAEMRFCYPDIPDYITPGTVNYCAGLAEPPTGVGSKWKVINHTMSSGTFRVMLRRGVGHRLMRTQSPMIDRISSVALGPPDTYYHYLTNAQAGITAGMILYANRAVLLVTVAGAGNAFFNATRHDATPRRQLPPETPLFADPPALTGRRVTVYRTLRTGGSALDESVILLGYVSGEPAAGLFGTTVEVTERFERATFGELPRRMLLGIVPGADEEHLGEPWVAHSGLVTEGWGLPLPGNASGAYIWVPKLRAVYAFTWNAAAATPHWGFEPRLVWTEEGLPPEFNDDAGPYDGYPVILSHADLDYPPFGYIDDPAGAATFVSSDNPAHIALCLLLSFDSANYPVGADRSYDMGEHFNYTTDAAVAGGLYPDYSLGVAHTRVDLDAFEQAAAELSFVRARWLWLGGTKPTEIADVFERLLAPWGYAVGTRRDGVWTVARLGDVYPGETTQNVDEQSLIDPSQWQHHTMGRAIDRVVLEVNPSPKGQSESTVTVQEVTAREYYPPHTGQSETYKRSPYDVRDFDRLSGQADLVGIRLERLGTRVAMIKASVNFSTALDLDLGDHVAIDDVALFDPSTGLKMTGAPLGAIVSSVNLNFGPKRGHAQFEALLTSTGNVRLISPSALVVSYNAVSRAITVDDDEFVRSGDTASGHFEVGQKVALIDSHGVLLSTVSGSEVAGVAAATITLDAHFVDGSGNITTMAAGSIVVFDTYDTVTSAQQDKWAHCSDSGAPGSGTPTLGAAADPAHIYGD